MDIRRKAWNNSWYVIGMKEVEALSVLDHAVHQGMEGQRRRGGIQARAWSIYAAADSSLEEDSPAAIRYGMMFRAP